MSAGADRPNVVLIGLMGSGKSTVGRHLADWLGVHLSDVDALIEYEQQRTITEIFESEGEARFRQLERDAVARVARITPSVIATGGGAFLDEANRAALRATGVIFYLRAGVETLFERVRHARHRPLLAGADMSGRLAQLLAEREPVYLTADHVVSTDGVSTEELVQRILALMRGATPDT